MNKKYPFKFLNSYQKEDKDFFFGRTEEVDRLYKMIFKTRILVVYGTSGTGKTSLIQCGLANKFNSYDWLSLYVRRGRNLVESLDRALCEHSGGAFEYKKDDKEGIQNLSAKIEAVYKAAFRPVYLIFDQFEELYVLGSKEEQKQFIKAIKKILSIDRPVKIILSIREEYLGYMYEFEREVPNLLRRKLRVEPMNIDKVKDVTKGINDYEDSLVSIKKDELNDITQEIFERIKGKKEKSLTIQLPYLQVFLDKLYMNQTGDKNHKKPALITMEDLKEIGDIGNVMQDFLVHQVKRIEEELKSINKDINSDTIWTILSDFCTLEGTKEPISKKKLAKGLPDIDDKIIHKAVDEFSKRRILRHLEDGDLYELAHDSLALKIMERRSADVVKMLEIQRFIKSKASLTGDLRETFTEREMIYIEPYLEKMGSKLGKTEKAFVKESQKNLKKEIKRKEREEKKKRRRVYWIFGIITFIVFIGGILLQREYLKGVITQDRLQMQGLVTNTLSELKDATNLKASNPTEALLLDGKIKSKLKMIEREEPYQMLRDTNYGFVAKVLFLNKFIIKEFDTLNSIQNTGSKQVEKHGEDLLKENQALYKNIKFIPDTKNSYQKKYTLSGNKALNVIFADTLSDDKFRIWSADSATVSGLYKGLDSVVQVVFPKDTSEAMVLFNNGTARYYGKNKAYKSLNMEALSNDGNTRYPVKITSIASITYEKIGYKLLSALNNEKIVQWNLNGTIRYNDSLNRLPVIYDKGDIQLGETVVSISISPKRHKIFTATDNGIGVIWLADTSKVVLPKDLKIAFGLDQDTIMSSSFSKDGSMIATGSRDNSIAIWDDKGKLIKKLKGHKSPVTSVTFSLYDKFLYSASADGVYKKWILPDSIKSAISYKSLKWHDLSKFDEIYKIDTHAEIQYNPPKLLTNSNKGEF